MKAIKLFCVASLLFAAHSVLAGTFINVNGSPENIAISGFDTVAFFTEKKALPGKAEYSFEWMGAKWLFSSQANLDLFKADPEKYAPQYGGNCSLGVSQGYISQKPTNGVFEIVEGKLYLFPGGRKSPEGAWRDWFRWGVQRSIADGDAHWPKLKARLEAK